MTVPGPAEPRPAEVEAREPPSTSPTSYSLLTRCERAWWFQYVGKMPRRSTAATERGVAVHSAIEHYLVTGTWPESTSPDVAQARRAESLLATWKAAADAHALGWASIEVGARLPLEPYGGVGALSGRIDWVGAGVRSDPEDVASPWVIDHKSGRPEYWKSPEQLAVDPQLLAYAAVAHKDHDGDVVVGHLYVPTPPTAPALVTTTARRADIEATVKRFASASSRMAELRLVKTADLVPPETRACWDFGGCAYAGACSAAPERLRARSTPDTDPTPESPLTPAQLALRARLGLSTPAPAVVPAPTPTPTPAEEAFPNQAVVEADIAGATLIVVVPAETPAEAATPSPEVSTFGAPHTAVAASILPPEARKRRKAAPAEPPPAPAPAPSEPVEATAPAPTEQGLGTIETFVLVDCVAADFWANTLENVFEAEFAAESNGAGPLGYLLPEYSAGVRRLAAAIADAVQRKGRALPNFLTVPSAHPLAPALLPWFQSRRDVLVIRGTR